MNEYLEKVEVFNILTGQKTPLDINIKDEKLNKLRIALIQEEFDELKKAISEYNEVEILDALIDLQYILSGTIISFGFKNIFDREFLNIDTNNKTKFFKSHEEAEKTIQHYRNKGVYSSIEKVEIDGDNNLKEIWYVVKNESGKTIKPYNYQSVKLNLKEDNDNGVTS